MFSQIERNIQISKLNPIKITHGKFMLSLKLHPAILASLLLLMFLIIFKTAWMSDDAAITLRSVLNLLNGYGPTFNIDERVQSFTHPLWFLLISLFSAIIGNIFLALFSLSFLCSLAVFWLLLTRVAHNLWTALFIASILLLSKAYIDFSTSGLENPLSHLLTLLCIIFGFYAIETQRNNFQRYCLFFYALLYLSRPDLILLLAPFCLFVLVKTNTSLKNTLFNCFITSLPILIWTSFSIVYYGFPFPNTAYAKLGTGIPYHELMFQGVIYLVDSIIRDPITLATIFLSFLISLRADTAIKSLAIGSFLYLIYIVSIGGDFMSGRFLTTPLIVALVIFSKVELKQNVFIAIALLLCCLGLLKINHTVFSPLDYEEFTVKVGIADERGFYFQITGFLTPVPLSMNEIDLTANVNQSIFNPFYIANPDWQPEPYPSVSVSASIGLIGLTKKSTTHIIDHLALADPLLARLPAGYNKNWRIGHFKRRIPTGYIESCFKQKNFLTDPRTKNYYDVIRNITRDPLFNWERFQNILRINLGLVPLPDFDYYRFQEIPVFLPQP